MGELATSTLPEITTDRATRRDKLALSGNDLECAAAACRVTAVRMQLARHTAKSHYYYGLAEKLEAIANGQ